MKDEAAPSQTVNQTTDLYAAALSASIIASVSRAQHLRLTIALQEHRLRLLQLAIEECLRAIEAK